MEQMINYTVYDEEKFTEQLHLLAPKLNIGSDEDKLDFRGALFNVQKSIETALKSSWKVGIDFKVGWDFDYCRFTSGGLYSEKAFCSNYVKAIHFALSEIDKEGKWVYHTSCEILVNPNGKTAGECEEDRGHFFNVGESCIINGDRMKWEWRRLIGSEV